MDHEEVAGEAELRDQRQLALELRAHLGGDLAVALARPLGDANAQFLDLVAPGFQPRRREAVRELVQPERTRLGDERGVRDRLGQVGEQARHLGRRAQPAGAVGLEQPARGVESAVLADAGEHVGERAVGGRRDQRVLGRHHAHAGRARQAREGGVARLLAAALVALHLHRHALRAEDPGEAAQHRRCRLLAALLQRPQQRSVRPAGERHEAGRVLLDQLP